MLYMVCLLVCFGRCCMFSTWQGRLFFASSIPDIENKSIEEYPAVCTRQWRIIGSIVFLAGFKPKSFDLYMDCLCF